ncbi:TFIIS helical bundle-like domain-containing protein [Carex littledalei]|uniref:TFIIS helical bundle-like domain-containing protein n=1 Tax=Carex littledalei TaxID=544730 RepID=A0A833VR46_9POAL|nr:TFIIS helical bundle-like domain-containing protein [Carex littledalei]
MNASTQSQTGGTRQPKSLNSPKASSDNTANGSPSPCSHHSLRSRKRDRADLAPQILPIKRDPDPFARAIEEEEASSGTGVDAAQEITKITELGGLKNPEIVEKMLKLMQLDRKERKIDLTGQVMLAGIIAGTDTANNDCLVKFVQMKGVTILDEWLQESHKGTQQGEHSNGKAVEELLLALLRALEKLPINLNTLRTCHIGKSVNNLRGHKNLEVQRKARFLVDMWKRRVDEEFKAQELKAGLTCQTQLPMPKPMIASNQKLQVSVDSQNKTGETEQSPNSSSSFGSIKSGPVMGGTALRHPRRAINGQLHHRTSTGPVTRSSDVPISMPDHSIGQRIVARMSNTSSPVKTHQFQGVKSKIDVKEDKDMEEASEKCAETGAGLVDSTGDDLGMLASVATGEISKAEPLSAVKEENENNSKNENKCASGGVHNNVQLHGETKKEDLQSDKDAEGRYVISQKDEVTSVKSEKTEGPTEDELATIPTKKGSTDDLPDQATGSTVIPATGTRVEFDLNEGILPLEDGPHLSASTSCHSLSNPPFAPKVTVAAPAKGSFNPPENLLRPMRVGETGWRGSGPTSAFRPAEPRRILDMSIGIGSNRPLLEIDLNVPDERLLEDVGTSQKPDEFALDLNITDGGASGFRDFDLNGPGASGPDESGTENYLARNQLSRVGPTSAGTITAGNINMQLLSPSPTGQLWFPAGSPFPGSVQGSYPVTAQRMVGPFGTGEVYRGLAVGPPGTHAVPYLGHHGQVQFPFGFSTGTASSYQSNLGQGPRPVVIAPEGSSSSMSVGSGKWGPVGRPVTSMGLDLNMGPVMGANGEVHGMVHVSPVLGGKRAEPEGWWDRPDRDKSSFGSSKKLSWQ